MVKVGEVSVDEFGSLVLEEGSEGVRVRVELLGEGRVLREEEKYIWVFINEIGEESVAGILQDQILEGFAEEDRLVVKVVVIVSLDEGLKVWDGKDCLHLFGGTNRSLVRSRIGVTVLSEGIENISVSSGGCVGGDRCDEVGVRVSGGCEREDLVEGKPVVSGDGGSGGRGEGTVLEVISEGGVLVKKINQIRVEGYQVHDVGIFVIGI